MDGLEAAPAPPQLPPGSIVDQTRPPSVIASHVDITYRVFGTGSGPEVDPQDDAGIFRRLATRSRSGVGVREVHAVRDVSFVAYRGESIGLIGRNGSGKSTLLRSIAGLVPPTGGQIWIDGRAALLGVGAVLLPKMTGRQNIHIGCLAQGFTPAQVEEVIDEIVEFADIGPFIDLPMNTYSTGMAARLRFAISTAAVPEILVIDEALATGDSAFKDKAQERIETFQAQAGTVFMVSHSRSSIEKMCDRVLWIDEGRVLADGEPEPVFGLYNRKYGKHRQVWRQRFEEAKEIELNEGPEAATEFLDRWDRRARRGPQRS
ncbi:ABC transporter ATP-binding protein [Ornithinimicrobium pratense]|uniref:ABC transporter ATP-binding protein n=1 Tax=Ornithinimicrobium pratense TaxID=2593973 RepID=A0A5J6V7H7_9MICO|nr:ABC transporter ATP-binding protein [Ornithinimicrobium pratense]QFG70020.1 ABC transporter ATP-binding protein [Ornithinimicrobium pratense]